MNDDAIQLSVFIARYPDIASEGAIRWQIFNRESNGLAKSKAVVKGRNGRWYVSPSLYRQWLAGGS